MWSDVYRPTKIQDMVGNEESRIIVAKWLLKWINGSKPLLLIGPPGVGKTTIIKALARQYNYDLIQMNASDTRNKEVLTETILPILRNRSLVAEKTLLFLDEIDGISGRQDAGGMESLLMLVKEPTVPIVMAANTKNTKLKALAKLCKVVEFDNVHPSLLLLYLDQILKLKGIDMPFGDKANLIKSAKGDIRSLLNIVQARISGYNAIRDSSFAVDISDVISDFSNSPTLEEAKKILMRVDGGYSDPRFGLSSEERRKDLLYAFFSSIITSSIEPAKMADALNVLSRCDVIVGRVSKDRHWTLLKYIPDILSYGLFSVLMGQKVRYNQYSLPWPISAPVIARRMGLREILVNLAHSTHTSVSVLGATYLPYLLNILHSQKVDLRLFAEGLGLDPKAAESLLKEIRCLEVSK